MRCIETGSLTPTSLTSDTEKLWVYNGLDCGVTYEVLDALVPEADNIAWGTYSYSRSLQGPILEMNMRGLLVDQDARAESLAGYVSDIEQVSAQLDSIVRDGIGVDMNWRSPKQLMSLLYDVMQLPVVKKRNANGGMSPTVNRDALEKLGSYFIAQPVINHLLILRDIDKKAGVLRTGIDPDGRFRTSFNIAGTTTGRLASSQSDFGTGSNAQNVEKRLRQVFVADPGMKFANIDLAQADARNVGALCWQLFVDEYGEDFAGKYLNATESGDLHTTVTRMAWTDLPWPEDPAQWRAVADQKAYRHLTFRDLAKKLGHGTNYYGTPPTMAKHTKVETALIRDFQDRYFGGFPDIKEWHNWTKAEIASTGRLITPFNRRRFFFGRRNDDSTIREAIASSPQSMTADEINQCMMNVWWLGKRLSAELSLPACAKGQAIWLMIQVHDSLVIQYPEELEDEILPQVLAVFKRPLILKHDREFIVPCDCQTGWNLNEVTKDGSNPDGLRGWSGPGSDTRKRDRFPPMNILERRVL